MDSRQNSSDFSFGGHWPHQDSSSNQPSQFYGQSTHFGDVDNASHPSMSYSFAPPVPSFVLQDRFDDPSSSQPNSSAPPGTAFTGSIQAMPTSSTVGPRLPPLQESSMTSSAQSGRFDEPFIHPPPRPRESVSRTLTLNPSDWEKHHDEIKRLYIDENKTLPETMEIMANELGFEPSLEQYKKQFKKWNWSKYVPTKEAFWMDSKATKRKREEKKDTIFDYRGQTYTKQSLQPRLQRKRNRPAETFSADAPTPSDIIYSTPRNDATSPLFITSPEMPALQQTSAEPPRWAPLPASNTPHPHQLNLLWNGHSKTDFEAVYHEAQKLERLVRIEDAENKYREALSGFENLLSSTHKDTTTVAYRLASFYAQNDRMKDADAVLDHMTAKHIERFGAGGPETIDHLLYVVEMFYNWSRNEEAKEFLSRILSASMGEPRDNEDEATYAQSSNATAASRMADNAQTGTNSQQPRRFGDPMCNADSELEPVIIDHELGVATRIIATNAKEAEPLLLRLISKCEKHPEDLAVQILRCRSALLYLYHKVDREKMNEALDQSKEAFRKIMNSERPKTQVLLDAGVEIAKWHVRARRYVTADDMFIQIQADAVDTFGADDLRIMTLFRRIGLFYQSEGRWDDAEPWFQQALVACYKTMGEESVYTKRLEAALEKQHYDMESRRADGASYFLRVS
ncbi:uncharacterized protein PAC_10578 [Phialocephala subalpina]|uniref:Clr5 domain-containing protein n=1 Tax=Phialocephala subalpina TaxID=576137 RepID=A0A1L7X6P9_9HELO|nr:uncharacterized protein PAC_10578 [Phialocephala subalpina]